MVKPDREIYDLILNRYHLKPEECLFIDDLEPNVKAAQAVGINTYISPTGTRATKKSGKD